MITFATYAAQPHELHNVGLLAQSLRHFGGGLSDSTVRTYVPIELAKDPPPSLTEVGVSIHPVDPVDKDAAWYYYAQKVFAAAQAESDLSGGTDVLAWLDEDAVILEEPSEFLLPKGVALAYRPVMHRNIGLPAEGPPDRIDWIRKYIACVGS